MRVRIVKEVNTDNTNEPWYTYYPEYKKWYNIIWHRWYDPFYGCADGFDTLEEAEKMIKEKLRRESFKTKKVKAYYLQ